MSVTMKQDRLHAVSLADLRTFLQGQGWDRSVSDDREWLVYTFGFPGMEEPARVVLPRETKEEDRFRRRRTRNSVESAIRTISGLLDRPPEEVVSRIRRQDRDRMAVHFPASAGGASLSLMAISKQIDSLKSLVAYATAAIENPVPHHANWHGRMKEMANHFQFGHTFAGSFGVSIESPITTPPARLEQLFDTDEPTRISPFEHRVMERVAASIRQVKQAEADGGVDRLVNGYREGANANICNSLATALKQARGGIRYAFEWSPQVDVSVDVIDEEPILLTTRLIPILEEAEQRLRTREPEEVEVVGRVIQLSAREPQRLGSRKRIRMDVARLRREGEKGAHRSEPDTVIVELDREAYSRAIRAHEEEALVQVTGRLVRSGNFWHLAKAHSLKEWHPDRSAEKG